MSSKEVMRKWVEALESGDYQQGTGQLEIITHGSHRYCCLGVLCHLAVQEGVIQPEQVVEEDGVVVYPDEPYSNGETLPSEVMKWAGLDERNPTLYPVDSGYGYMASELNDSLGCTFGEIAQAIRDTWEIR